MSGNYWIKLYIEILDDSKMATLPPQLWKRTIELFLLAGRYHKDGHLPDTNELAWALRCPMEDLDLDLRQLALTEIIKKTDTGWLVVKFAERQAKMTPAEKMQQYRNRQRKEQYYGDDNLNVTDELLKVTQITDNRLTDAEADGRGNLFSLYENEIGTITQMIAEELKDAEKEYPADWFSLAFMEAVTHNARNWKYVLAILKRWKIEGVGSNGKKEDHPQDYVFYEGKWINPLNIPTEVY